MTADLAGALARQIEGEVLFDDYTRHIYARDASMYAISPRGVVTPRHAGDVVAAVTLAAEHGVPVLPRGAGTSLAGQTCSPVATAACAARPTAARTSACAARPTPA
jgi:FAD/FMN-containing dehydrogenase